jgi:hypothetical protein
MKLKTLFEDHHIKNEFQFVPARHYIGEIPVPFSARSFLAPEQVVEAIEWGTECGRLDLDVPKGWFDILVWSDEPEVASPTDFHDVDVFEKETHWPAIEMRFQWGKLANSRALHPSTHEHDSEVRQAVQAPLETGDWLPFFKWLETYDLTSPVPGAENA